MELTVQDPPISDDFSPDGLSTADSRALNAALVKVLERLARLTLRNGQTFEQFSELAKHVFVDVAEKDFPIEGRKISASRISTITGIPRKEVARVMKLAWDSDADITQKRNRAARVLTAWLRDIDFHDSKGDPLDLPMDGDPGFGTLVRKYSGDVTPRAVADELQRLGAIQLVDDKYRLTARGYVPGSGKPELFEVLGSDTAELMDTIDFNIARAPGVPGLLQQKVVYDNVPVEYVEAFRRVSRRMGERLLIEMDHWLAEHDRDRGESVLGTGRARLGLMVFQIQQILEDEPEGDS